MIKIDGSFGEGGGQILRSALGLSMYTGKAFTIENIRAGRKKPGLMRQHLTAVRAGREICGAKVEGDEIGSQTLTFRPGAVKSGDYRFSIGTAGSCTLVLQAILPSLLTAKGGSRVTFEGGTHNPMAPPFHFLNEAFFRTLREMGVGIECSLGSYGFYPAGGGSFEVVITPAAELKQFELDERGELLEYEAKALVAKIPYKIAEEEIKIIRARLGWEAEAARALTVESRGPGNIVMIKLVSERVTELFTGFGEKGLPLKVVANRAAGKVQRYLNSRAVVDEYLADQLLIPMALAGGGSFTTHKPSMHTITNIEVIKQFMELDFECREIEEDLYKIVCSR